jgi:hypothetical protein
MIPVVGNCKTDVSSIIRTILKHKDCEFKNCSSPKKSALKYDSLLLKKFSQEETKESSMFSQPTICLSCDSKDHHSCEDSKCVSGGSNFCHGKSRQVPNHSEIDTIIPKSAENYAGVQLSKHKSGSNLTYEGGGLSKNDTLHSSEKENFLVSRENVENREEFDIRVCSESTLDTSYDLFDSPQPLKKKSPNIMCTCPCRKYSDFDTDKLEHVFPLRVNNFQRNVKLCARCEFESCNSFSQEVFTPSPTQTLAYKLTYKSSSNPKKLSSSKCPSLLRRRPTNISSQLTMNNPASGGEMCTEAVRETGSPLLFSDTSFDSSVTSPHWDLEDGSLSCSILSPDIFTSTPSHRTLTNKATLAPYLAKQICKD